MPPLDGIEEMHILKFKINNKCIVLVSSGKAARCTGTETDWNIVDSDHAGVKLWLDVRNLNKRGPGLFKVNGSLIENPKTLETATEQINTMMQQMDPTYRIRKTMQKSAQLCLNPHVQTFQC